MLLSGGFVLLLAIVSASSASEFDARSTSKALPPSKDPFYTAPKNYENAAPGKVLRTRVAQGDTCTVVANCSKAYNILYRTTNSRYMPAWAVTTLYIPKSPQINSKTAGHNLLSYQFPYDSLDVDASPSYAFLADPPSDISTALSQGWFVNMPDYEGPEALFLAGLNSGHATLDSVRAALSANLGLGSKTQYAMWGYSGGSLATEWAAELQVQYAPELTFAGAAIGGLPPNVSSVLNLVNGGDWAGLVPLGVLGLAKQYPDVYNYITSKLNPSGNFNKTTFLSSLKMSDGQASETFLDQDVSKYFINGESDLYTPAVQKIWNNDGVMGYHGIPQMPLFVYKAIADEISAIADTDALVDRYCPVGVNILYQRNTVGGHEAESTNGAARAVQWLGKFFEGSSGIQGCTIENVTVNITSSPI